MTVPKCARCIWLLVLLITVLFGCQTAVKSVDYYNACLNDAECLHEMQTAQNLTTNAMATSLDHSAQYSTIAQLIGGVTGSVVAYFVGVVRGKKLTKGQK